MVWFRAKLPEPELTHFALCLNFGVSKPLAITLAKEKAKVSLDLGEFEVSYE